MTNEADVRNLLMRAQQDRNTALLALRQSIMTKGAAEEEQKIRKELDLLDVRITMLKKTLGEDG